MRLTKDGIPVVFHDRRTGRLDAGGRDVLVNSMPLSALQRMIMQQRACRYSVPTLRQALDDASMSRPGQRRFGLLLDIKTDARYARKVADAVVRVVEDSKYAGNLMVMSANPYAVMVFKSMRPQWHVGLCASGRPDLTQWDDDGTSEARFMDGAARVETVRREVTAKRGGKQRKHPMFRGMRGEAMDFVVFRTRDVTSRLLRNARLRRIPVYDRLGGFISMPRTACCATASADCSARTSRRCSRLVRHITGFPNRSRRRTMTIAPRRDAGRSRVGA